MISMSENDELSVRLSVQSRQQQGEEGEVICWIANNSPSYYVCEKSFQK